MKIHESYKYVVWIILLLIISPNVRSQIDKNKKQINVLDFGAIPNDGTIEGVSAIALHVKAPNTNVAGLHKRILIENNVINGGKHAIVVKGSEDVTIRNNSFKEIDGQPIIIGASIRVKAYNNEGGQLIGEKLAPPVLPNLN